jgi:hypothetical protein
VLLRVFSIWRGCQVLERHVLLDEFATLSNFNSSLLLVSSQDPYADISFNQLSDGLRHAILQLIFDGSRANKSQILFVLVIEVV